MDTKSYYKMQKNINNYTDMFSNVYVLAYDSSKITEQRKIFIKKYINLINVSEDFVTLLLDKRELKEEIKTFFKTTEDFILQVINSIPLQRIDLSEDFFITHEEEIKTIDYSIQENLKKENSLLINDLKLYRKQLEFILKNADCNDKEKNEIKNEIKEVDGKLSEYSNNN